jgi:hypothetical protein
MYFALRMLLAAALFSTAASAALAADAKINCYIQRGTCMQKTGDGMIVEFDIQPKPVAAMSDLAFIITITKRGRHVTGSSAALDLTMPGMVMGKNLPVMKQTGAGRFEGKGVIPNCPSGGKIWKADVIFVHEGKTDVAGFVFEVK